ncbi:MAG: hypothetical protein AVDCRST_MAG05-1200 [uncultured Rubrobacteraceae bacterium]|uniref:Uncharacterized protein n=1 Tax=uncultured Rubrobacteraceae bacterium TaxID=349277 RepID=A0A6J4RQK5_9ACTN|nr:MAG: hypothetical protein AVDCRST_MAG05-1200 [uncultured Rubrobacteraceae bacterium]
MNADYLAAKMESVRALGRDGSPAAEGERAALIGAMAGLGLPVGRYVRDPSRPPGALLLRSASALVSLLVAALCCDVLAPSAPQPGLSPAAYLQAAPAILCCLAVLCALGTAWHLLAFLFPRAALVSDFEGRKAWADALGHPDRTAGHRAPSDGR